VTQLSGTGPESKKSTSIVQQFPFVSHDLP
jgi:hypothetical protein